MLETVQAMHVKCAVKIVRPKVYISFSQFDDLDLHISQLRSQLRLKFDFFFLYTSTIIVIS